MRFWCFPPTQSLSQLNGMTAIHEDKPLASPHELVAQLSFVAMEVNVSSARASPAKSASVHWCSAVPSSSIHSSPGGELGAKRKKKKQKRKKEKPSSGGTKSDSASDSQEIKVWCWQQGHMHTFSYKARKQNKWHTFATFWNKTSTWCLKFVLLYKEIPLNNLVKVWI